MKKKRKKDAILDAHTKLIAEMVSMWMENQSTCPESYFAIDQLA